MPGTVFLEAFGQLSRDTSLEGVVSEREDLYSVFNARAEFMNWSSTTMGNDRSDYLLWGINEAELTAGIEASRIGWVQVGLAEGVEPVMALPPLVWCFDDALRRFGVVELSGLQVTASHVEPCTQSCLGYLVGGLNWFNTTQKARAKAIIAFDNELLRGHTEAEVVARLERDRRSFEFGPLVHVTEQYTVKVPVEMPWSDVSPARSGLGMSVTLPEWTASSVGWVLAKVTDAARAIAPNVLDFAVRVTRIQ